MVRKDLVNDVDEYIKVCNKKLLNLGTRKQKVHLQIIHLNPNVRGSRLESRIP